MLPSNIKVLFVSLAVLAIANCVFGEGSIECNKPNEEYQCGSACQRKCQSLGEPCSILNIKCNDACYCIEGYARIEGDTSKCVPISECPPKSE